MVKHNTDSGVLASGPVSGAVIKERSAERAPSQSHRSAPRKLLSIMGSLMDIMVDGLAPGVKNQRRTYQLIVVGAAPAGTAAAVCAASEGIDTLIVEAGPAEGGPQFIECIDDCAAIPGGVTLGGIRTESLEGQGRRYLLDMQPGLAVTGIRADCGYWQLPSNRGHWLQARAIILAPGLYRRPLGVPGEESLIGAGVHTCASCEGPIYAGRMLLLWAPRIPVLSKHCIWCPLPRALRLWMQAPGQDAA